MRRGKMSERRTAKRVGWLLGFLVGAALIVIVGAPRPASSIPVRHRVSPAAAKTGFGMQPGPARADADTLDLQLD
jgi:hypothetical protein